MVHNHHLFPGAYKPKLVSSVVSDGEPIAHGKGYIICRCTFKAHSRCIDTKLVVAQQTQVSFAVVKLAVLWMGNER